MAKEIFFTSSHLRRIDKILPPHPHNVLTSCDWSPSPNSTVGWEVAVQL
jgi:hypothetical protein